MSDLPKQTDLRSQTQFRIIPSIYPPINFFEELVDPAEMDTLWEIEGLTNERLRQEVGDIFLVPAADRVCGPGSSVVMAAFTHLSKPTRFSDGSYGVYYASLSEETAIRETVYQREKFLRATSEAAAELTMRLYQGTIEKPLHDLRGKKYHSLHVADNYLESQAFGRVLRDSQSWGIIYHSVRHKNGICVAALRPPAISIPTQISHLKYIWNGKRIIEVLNTQTILRL